MAWTMAAAGASAGIARSAWTAPTIRAIGTNRRGADRYSRQPLRRSWPGPSGSTACSDQWLAVRDGSGVCRLLPAAHRRRMPRPASRSRSAAPRATSSTGTTRPPAAGLLMLTPPISARRPPNQSCQPQPPPEAARTAAMNRKATPEAERAQSVGLDPGGVEQPRRGERGDDRPGVERSGAAIDRPLGQECEADREHQRRCRSTRIPG